MLLYTRQVIKLIGVWLLCLVVNLKDLKVMLCCLDVFVLLCVAVAMLLCFEMFMLCCFVVCLVLCWYALQLLCYAVLV